MPSDRSFRADLTDESLDHVTCSIAQLSDDDIEEMGRQDLIDMLWMSRHKPPGRELVQQLCMDMGRLKQIARQARDRCRSRARLVYASQPQSG